MKAKVGIIGRGNVGSALKSGLDRAGYETKSGGRGSAGEIAEWGEIVILAVPYSQAASVLTGTQKALHGKIVVDPTNAFSPELEPELPNTTSAAEELQRSVPSVKIVKCFNTMFAAGMSSGNVKGEQISAFVAGDDAGARATVLELARDIGFDAVDCGALRNSRLIEATALFNVVLGFGEKLGTDIGFKLVR